MFIFINMHGKSNNWQNAFTSECLQMNQQYQLTILIITVNKTIFL